MINRYVDPVRELVRRVGKIEKRIRDQTANTPLFDISNENTPDQITADQNNYDPGWYDVLRISSSADVSITGITKGKKGRFLELYNVGDYKITLPFEGMSSDDVNRIINSTGEHIILFPTARVRLYYDSTLERWIVPDMPSFAGDYGMSVSISIAAQPIPDGISTRLLFDTVITDEFGLYDSGTDDVRLPDGFSGFWEGSAKGYWDAHATGGNIREIILKVNGGIVTGLSVPSIANEVQWLSLPIAEPLNFGDVLDIYVKQTSGGDLFFNGGTINLVRVR